MGFDEGIAERLRQAFGDYPELEERRMFGGLVFMVYGHMSCGVLEDRLMVRVGPEQYPRALSSQWASEMDFTGKPLKGFVYIASEGFEDDIDLKRWVQTSLDFVTALEPK